MNMLSLMHKKLDVWKLSIEFTCDIYEITDSFPKKEMFLLSNQLRRAAVSIASNIDEGCSRSSVAERKRFFEIARSSLVEIDTQFEISKRLKYINDVDIDNTNNKFIRLFSMLSKLIRNTH